MVVIEVIIVLEIVYTDQRLELIQFNLFRFWPGKKISVSVSVSILVNKNYWFRFKLVLTLTISLLLFYFLNRISNVSLFKISIEYINIEH
jgi:hypothetical protein